MPISAPHSVLRSALLTTTLLSAGAFGGPVRAQEGEAFALPTVRIEGAVGDFPVLRTTTAKTPLPLLETPQAVSVVTGEDLRDRPPVRDIAEALTYSPGVLGETFGADTRNDWFLIRGFASQQQSYFADGLQLPSNAFATWRLDPFTLEQVEVLRGPSSALYGAANPGGLVNAVTKRALPGSFGEGRLGVDENGRAYGGIDVNRGTERLAFRLAVSGRVGETAVDDVEDDGYAIAPSLTWSPDPQTTFQLYGNILADRTNGQNFLPYVGTEQEAPFGYIDRNLFTSEPDLDQFERDQWLAGWLFERRLEGGPVIRQNLRYSELDVEFRTLFGGGYVAPPSAVSAELARFNFLTTPHTTLFNVDNQVAFDLKTGPASHAVLFGLEYKRYTLDDEQGFEFGSPLDILDPEYNGATAPASRFILDESKQEQIALYAQDAIDLGNLSVLGSARADYVDLDVENRLDPAAGYSETETVLSGRLGVLYTLPNGLSPYASISRSFLPVVGRSTGSGKPFEAETGAQVEVGVKWALDAWDTQLTATAFRLVRKNVVQTDAAFLTDQVGEITSRGFELELHATPLPGLLVHASALLSEVEVTQGPEIDEGNVPVATPESLFSVYADYTPPEGPLDNFGLGFGVRHIGRSFADRDNAFEVAGITLFDGAIHYSAPQFEGARLTLAATNLLDERYVASCSGVSACFYGQGRTASLTLGYVW